VQDLQGKNRVTDNICDSQILSITFLNWKSHKHNIFTRREEKKKEKKKKIIWSHTEVPMITPHVPLKRFLTR
jgi:hypothetical protein